MEGSPNSAMLGSVVFHAIRSKRFFGPDGRVSPSLFMLRPVDTDGLSVDIQSAKSCSESLDKCHGVVVY